MYRSVLNSQLHFSDKEHYLWVPYFCCPSFCWNMLIINMLITSVLTILSSSEHCACKQGGDMKTQSTWTIWWEKPCLTTTDKEEYSRFILPPLCFGLLQLVASQSLHAQEFGVLNPFVFGRATWAWRAGEGSSQGSNSKLFSLRKKKKKL